MKNIYKSDKLTKLSNIDVYQFRDFKKLNILDCGHRNTKNYRLCDMYAVKEDEEFYIFVRCELSGFYGFKIRYAEYEEANNKFEYAEKIENIALKNINYGEINFNVNSL